jgi:hypothetical protein
VVGSENGEIGKGFREMLRPAKDGAIPVDDRVALAWIFKQCGTASSSVKPTSMGISDAVRILSDGARHFNEFEPPCQMEVEPVHLRRGFPVSDAPDGERPVWP